MVLSAGRSKALLPRLASRRGRQVFLVCVAQKFLRRLLSQNSAAESRIPWHEWQWPLRARPAPVLSVILLHRASKSHRQSQRLLLVAVVASAAGVAGTAGTAGAGWC